MADNSTSIQQRMADNSTSIQQHAPWIKWATWQLLWARRKWPAALVGSAHVHGAAWQHAAATWPQCRHLRGITSAAQHAPNAANVGRSGADSSGDGEPRGRVGGVLGTGTAWRRPHAAWHRRPTDERVGPTGQLRAPDALGAGSASAAGLAAARRRGEPHGQGHGEPGGGGPAALRRGRDRRAVRHDRCTYTILSLSLSIYLSLYLSLSLSIYLSIYIYIYSYIYIYTYIYIYIYNCVYIYIYTYTHVYIYTYTYTHL